MVQYAIRIQLFFKVLFGGIIMKKILAVILTIVMLLGIAVFNSSADTTDVPASVTLVTNSGSPLDVEGKVAQDGSKYIFTVRFDRFILIRGIDITIDAGEAIITDVETFNLPTAVDGRDEFDENWRYVRGKSSIRFVDLNITSKSRIVLSVQDPSIAPISDDGEAVSLADGKFGTQKITVTGKYADTGETLVPITTKPQYYEVMKSVDEETTKNNGDVAQPTEKDENGVGYFIPFGGIYKENGNDITYTQKETDGSFKNVPAGSIVQKFRLPRYEEGKDGTVINQLTTFGISELMEFGEDPWATEQDKPNVGVIKMGSYTTYDDFNTAGYGNDTNDNIIETQNRHGTLVFDGDWLSLKHYYIKQGNTVQQFVRAIFKQMTQLENNTDETKVGTNIVDNHDTKFHVTYAVPKWDEPEKTVHVRVYKFPRVKYMWRDAKDSTDGKGEMEYAIRLHNAEEKQTYTGVGYCLEYKNGKYDLDQVQISYNVKSFGTEAHSNNTATPTETPNS